VVGIRNASQPTRCRITYQDYELERGDVLLLETFKNKIGTDKWLETFGVVRQVPNSEPPRTGRKNDTLRAVALCVGLVVFLVCGIMHSSFPDVYPWNKLSNVVVATMLATFILVIRGITLKEAYSEINAPVLFTIAGALAIGVAMQKTRLANCVAEKVLFVVSPFGKMGVKIGMYVATVGIGQFLNSQGNATLMGVIAIPLADTAGIPVGELALTVVYAASACYMSPYGYQTNTLVMKPGNYEWGDYIRFGGLLQRVHMITVVLIVGPCASLIEATGL
jgi:di/tricarboxylate transporter